MAKCPIDNTELTSFNQYDLSDGTICKTCAKRVGLVGWHQSLTLANASKALLTVKVIQSYINENKKIDYKLLIQTYKDEQKSGNSPTGWQMFKLDIQDADNDNIVINKNEISKLNAEISKLTEKNEKLSKKIHELKYDNEQLTTENAQLKTNQRHSAGNYSSHYETESNQIVIANEPSKPKKSLKQKLDYSKLVCPVCKSANITKNEVNTEEISKTSVNLNPLHPLTFANTKKKKKTKKSAGKIAMGIATGGSSMLVTGVHKKTSQYRCLNCGHIWTAK